jgi:hypothetical protein
MDSGFGRLITEKEIIVKSESISAYIIDFIKLAKLMIYPRTSKTLNTFNCLVVDRKITYLDFIFEKKNFMKKIISSIIAIIGGCTIATAQPPANATVYDCNSNSKNIYQTLGTGKSIIIASKGFDCSICMNSAPTVQSWAAQNKTKVEVWGAMTYTYRTTLPDCSNIASWKNTYNWNDVFMFIDSAEAWFQNGTPKYITYSAIDSSILYQGSNFTTARNFALGSSTVGIPTIQGIEQSNIYSYDGILYLSNLPESVQQLSIYDLTGKLISSSPIINTTSQFGLSQRKSVLIIRLYANDGSTYQQKIMTNY